MYWSSDAQHHYGIGVAQVRKKTMAILQNKGFFLMVYLDKNEKNGQIKKEKKKEKRKSSAEIWTAKQLNTRWAP